jgi:hypothetical protein
MIKETLDPTLAALYQKHGLSVTAPKGNSRWGQTMVCAEHDDVPYCMDAHGKADTDPEQLKRDVQHTVTRRALIIERHHAKIKAVYEYCQSLGVGDIWVMCGGGAQLQAFFGNQSGYLAILYLDLEDIESQESMSEYLASCGNKTFLLQVNWAANDKLFEGRFNVNNIELRLHRAVYGAED